MKTKSLTILFLALGLSILLTWGVAAQGAEARGAEEAIPDAGAIGSASVSSQDPGRLTSLGHTAAITFTPVATTYIPALFKGHVGCTTVPALISPPDGNNLGTLVPLFRWDSGNDPYATKLVLEAAQDPDFTQDVSSFSSSYRTTGIHEYRFGWNFDPATTYYWRAWLTCGEAKGPYSGVWSFATGSGGVILPAPALSAPADGRSLSSLPVTLRWSAVGGAVEYRVFWRRLDQGGYTARWVTGTQTEIRGLEAGTTYEWWVSARNDYAIGDASETWQFTTPVGSLSSPRGLNPPLAARDGVTIVFEE